MTGTELLIGASASLGTAAVGWVFFTLVQHGQDIRTLQGHYETITESMDRLETSITGRLDKIESAVAQQTATCNRVLTRGFTHEMKE